MKLSKNDLRRFIMKEMRILEANQGISPKTGRAWSISSMTGQKHWGGVPNAPKGTDPRMGALKKKASSGSDAQSGDIGPLEYKLADAIGKVYEQHELAMGGSKDD